MPLNSMAHSLMKFQGILVMATLIPDMLHETNLCMDKENHLPIIRSSNVMAEW